MKFNLNNDYVLNLFSTTIINQSKTSSSIFTLRKIRKFLGIKECYSRLTFREHLEYKPKGKYSFGRNSNHSQYLPNKYDDR